jgi:hypothetical protein
VKESDQDKIEKLFQKLNETTKKKNSIYPREIEKAKNHFKNGYFGECFLGLANVLEYQLHTIWLHYLANSSKKTRLPSDSLGLRTYADILWQVGHITISQKNNLIAFQKGRNTIAHFTAKHFQNKGHPSEETLEDQFKKGVKVANELSDHLTVPTFNFDPKTFQKKSK